MQNLKLFWGRFKSLIVDAWPFWLFLIVVAIAIFSPFYSQLNPADHVHNTGFLLQFSAFFTIILRIIWVHKHFSDDGQGFIGLIIGWLKRLISICKKPREMKVALESGKIAIGGSIANLVISAEKTLEQRVADLEKQQRALKNELKETESRLNKRINEKVSELIRQIKALEIDITQIKNEAKVFKVGSLKWEIVWSLWLILGLTIRHFSQEIGNWFM